MWQLDRWVIVQVLEALARRYQNQQSMPVLFAGISGNSIIDDTFSTWLKKRFEETGLPGSVLVIEVKEDTAEAQFEKL
ncbi:MAG: EAL domain-containing protein, partial [Gammaproteobacteria bacterium]|nr:EAL domain-containing protein [Gammaproteobacteria bacterium]